jgi:hypothetical protein
MVSKLQLRCTVPKFAKSKGRMISRGQTVQEVIWFITKVAEADVNELSLDDVVLPAGESFYDLYESKDQLFVFSKASPTGATSHSVTRPPHLTLPSSPPPPSAATPPSHSPAQASPAISPARGHYASDDVRASRAREGCWATGHSMLSNCLKIGRQETLSR